LVIWQQELKLINVKTIFRVLSIILIIPNIGNIAIGNSFPIAILINVVFIYFGWIHKFKKKDD